MPASAARKQLVVELRPEATPDGTGWYERFLPASQRRSLARCTVRLYARGRSRILLEPACDYYAPSVTHDAGRQHALQRTA